MNQFVDTGAPQFSIYSKMNDPDWDTRWSRKLIAGGTIKQRRQRTDAMALRAVTGLKGNANALICSGTLPQREHARLRLAYIELEDIEASIRNRMMLDKIENNREKKEKQK